MFLSMPLGKFLSRANENSSHVLLGRAFVYTNAQNLRFPAMPETVGSACWGSTPNPLNSVSRWLRRYEPDGFLKNAITFYGVVCDYAGKPASPFSKIPPKGGREKRRNGAQPQNEILRKGVWGRCHQQAKTAFRRSRQKAVLSLCGNKDTACKVVYLRKTSYATSSFSGRTQYSKKSFTAIQTGLITGVCSPPPAF